VHQLVNKKTLIMLNDDSSHVGCHTTSKGYAVPDILKQCRAFRMSGSSSVQQHSIMNQETLIFSDTVVGTSNTRTINKRG